MLKKFEIVLASIQIKNKLQKAQFFKKRFYQLASAWKLL